MEPLKVTFTVSGGFVPPPYPVHLDALLAYIDTQDRLPELDDNDNVTVEDLRALANDLPLGKYERDNEWVWQASAFIPENTRLSVAGRFFTQRLNAAEYAKRFGNGHIIVGRHRVGAPLKPYQYEIDTIRGTYRHMLGYYQVQDGRGEPLRLVAYCIGNKDIIHEMLTSGRLSHIGARRRAGHGRIIDVQVGHDDSALEKWTLRVKPWPMRDDDVSIQAAWRAPYWARENQGHAYCPAELF